MCAVHQWMSLSDRFRVKQKITFPNFSARSPLFMLLSAINEDMPSAIFLSKQLQHPLSYYFTVISKCNVTLPGIYSQLISLLVSEILRRLNYYRNNGCCLSNSDNNAGGPVISAVTYCDGGRSFTFELLAVCSL